MDESIENLGADFVLWQQLTDDYEAALEAFAQGEPDARERMVRLSRVLQEGRPSLSPHAVSPEESWIPGFARATAGVPLVSRS